MKSAIIMTHVKDGQCQENRELIATLPTKKEAVEFLQDFADYIKEKNGSYCAFPGNHKTMLVVGNPVLTKLKDGVRKCMRITAIYKIERVSK